MPRRLQHLLNLADFEVAARRHLPRAVHGYVAGAAEDEVSLRANRRRFADYAWLPRVLNDVSRVDSSVVVLGQKFAAPFGIAPIGMSALSAYRGDLVLAGAAAAASVPMIISGSSLIPMEAIAQAYPSAWFQAYLPGEDAQIEALLQRVSAAGFRTLVITVDTPVAANQENYIRAGFSAPLRPSLSLLADGLLHPRWTLGTFLRTLMLHGMPHFENNYATRGAPILARRVLRDFSDRGHLNWRHLARIRRSWRGHLVIKGLLNPLDADVAVEHGVDGVIVSNHGGRQLDGAASPLSVLSAFVRRCGSLPVMIDSGFRRGTDVLKAIALGARLAFVGRPFLCAAAVAGRPGLDRAIQLLLAEVRRDLTMLGVSTIDALDAQVHLRHQGSGCEVAA